MSDATGSGDTGNPTGGDAPGGGAGADALNAFDWQTSLGDGYDAHKGAIEAKGWKGPGDVLKAYGELESKLGDPDSLLRIPGENATPEEQAAFHKRLGVPDASDGYEFQKPENIAYNDDMANWFREAGHRLNISASALSGLHDAYFEEIIKPYEADKAKAAEEAKQQLDADIAQNWPEDERAKNKDFAIRGGKFLGLEAEDFDKLGGMCGDFKLVNACRVLGEMVAEDALVGGGGAGGAMGAEAAKAELAKFKDDPEIQKAYADNRHPQHREVHERYKDLRRRALMS